MGNFDEMPAVPYRPPQLYLSLGSTPPVRAAQLSSHWEPPGGQAFSASALHPLDFFGPINEREVSHFIIILSNSTEIELQFNDDFLPHTVYMRQWSAQLAEIGRDAMDDYELIELNSSNTFLVDENSNDYIYCIKAVWPYGYQFYTFRIHMR